MELILATLLLVLGGLSDSHPDMTYEQFTQAAMTASVEAEKREPVPGFAPRDPQKREAPKVKGLFVSAYTASAARMDSLLRMIDDTPLNAMVIDVKDDWGYIMYDTGNEKLKSMNTTRRIIPDIGKLMERLEQHDVYPIARIVVFKDTVLAKQQPELSFLNPDGTVWANSKRDPESFVNPYRKEVWDYNIEVAKEAAKAGFKEIQFDYVRFPEGFETRADVLSYTKDERSRTDVVAEFVEYAYEQLNPLGVRVSVDIFGYAASVPAAEGIGQDFLKISQHVDVISPMVYPSHYTAGWFGSRVPDAAPYTTIYGSMVDTLKKLEPLGDYKPVVRPWLQDFTATWISGYIPYGKREVEEQIRALHDNGIEEFLLWNSGNVYSQGVDYLIGLPAESE